jgi:hypothetical protein
LLLLKVAERVSLVEGRCWKAWILWFSDFFIFRVQCFFYGVELELMGGEMCFDFPLGSGEFFLCCIELIILRNYYRGRAPRSGFSDWPAQRKTTKKKDGR